MKSIKIVCISSGIRKQSNSQAVMSSVIELISDRATCSQLPIGAYPHYSQDLEQDALPELIHQARALIEDCDAVIIVTSEYNHGIPGVLKNALDWLSRPVRASAMKHKPVLFISQSTGALGGVRAQYQLRETLSSMLCELVPLPEITIASIANKIVNGKLQDEKAQQFMATQLNEFLTVISNKKE
ncbi:NADPH-dependent FMN reductase [Celerinatantimonas sp. MCCC 1A17872]|uniref:NADPH-dependent FMN reductase n=1 Tax=Celerinatantimonas sp. MCCC 1A17872 TaxID=3177514 RepID=UPI0038C89E2A